MSARENILAKLKKADALPMEEPPVFDYYREMGVSWANDVERLKHWAAAMRTVKTEIYWVTKSNWPQVFRQAAEGKGLKNILLPLETEHGQLARAALADTNIEPRGFERKIDDWKNEFLPILRLDLAALNAVLPVPVRLCWSPALSSRAA